MHEYVVTPDEVWEANVEATPLAQDEVVASPDLALDVGQSLSPLVIKAQRPRRAGKSFTVKVPQQFVDGRRPWATYAPNCLTDPDDPRVRTTGERKLWLNHVAYLAVARSCDEQAKAELRLVKVEDVPVPLGPTT